MTRLTEEMVVARTKESNLSLIKQFNCWGTELTDVSIFNRMRGVEVVSLSINKITSLQPFAECHKLQELYIRKNAIRDINEISHLKNLPSLKYLWLEENPFCEKLGANYRAVILRALPNLKKLDNIDVTEEEVIDALRSAGDDSPGAQEEDSQEDAHEQQQHQIPPQVQHQQHQASQHSSGRGPQAVENYQSERPHHSPHYRQNQTDLTDWDEHPHAPHHNLYGSSAALHHTPENPPYHIDYARESVEWEEPLSSRPRRTVIQPPSVNSAVFSQYTPVHRRPVSRTSNILNAALCLVQELDSASLEVLERSVRSRINELSNE